MNKFVKQLLKLALTQAAPAVIKQLATRQQQEAVLTQEEIRLTQLERRIEAIEERNKKVEAAKAWETSWTRKICVALLIYIVVAIFLQVIQVDRAWLSALIPAVGFFLSTFTLPFLKQLWLDLLYKH